MSLAAENIGSDFVSTISAIEWLNAGNAAPNINVSGVKLVRHTAVFERRGRLTVGEYGRELPFVPRRFFVISDVPSQDVRGEHAHKIQEQYLVCLAGKVNTIVDDGMHRQEIILDCPQVGIYLPAMTWGVQYNYSPNAILLVLSSAEYDPVDYIRHYSEFQLLLGAQRAMT